MARKGNKKVRRKKRQQEAKRRRNGYAGCPPKGSGAVHRCILCLGRRVGRTKHRVWEYEKYGVCLS